MLNAVSWVNDVDAFIHRRGFAVGGGEISIETVPLAADTLYPGSPETNAVQLTVDTFGADQGFDHEAILFPLAAGHDYSASVYIRSANSGGAEQGVGVSFPVFDDSGFTGRAPGSFDLTAGSSWQSYTGPSFQESGGTVADLGFRLVDDGGENSILAATNQGHHGCQY